MKAFSEGTKSYCLSGGFRDCGVRGQKHLQGPCSLQFRSFFLGVGPFLAIISAGPGAISPLFYASQNSVPAICVTISRICISITTFEHKFSLLVATLLFKEYCFYEY